MQAEVESKTTLVKAKPYSSGFNSRKKEEVKSDQCCSNPEYRIHQGFYVCKNCGVTGDQKYLNEPKRAYGLIEHLERDQHYHVDVLRRNKTIFRIYESNNIKKYKRLRQLNHDALNSFERMKFDLEKMIMLCNEYPAHIVENIKQIYLKAWKYRILPGRNRFDLLAAVILYAARINKYVITTDMLLKKFPGIGKHQIILFYQFCISTFGKPDLEYINPEKYISKANPSPEVFALTLKILQYNRKNKKLIGKHSQSITAGAIYLAGKILKKKMAQGDIAEIYGISEATVRQRIKDLVLPEKYKKQVSK